MPADGDLDDTVRRVDPERWLSSRFIGDATARTDVIVLYSFEHELDRARRVTSNALLAEIRLTWWREVLDEIFSGGPVRRHPVAQALSETVRRRSLGREALETMIDARIDGAGDAERWAAGTAGSLAMLAARTLDRDADVDAVAAAGRAWGLYLLHRGGRTDVDPERAVGEAGNRARRVSSAAFPVIAHVTLIRAENPSPLEIRARLIWSVLRGRI